MGGGRLLFLMVSTFLPFQWVAAAAGDLASDVTLPEYSSHGLSVTGQVQVGRLFIDHKRWGFFRIGALPLLVAENVRVQIQSEEYFTNGLDDLDLSSWRQLAKGAARQELRQLEINVAGEKEPRLRAAVASIGPDGEAIMSAVTILEPAGSLLSLRKATLQISGPSAGQLSWNAGGHPEKRFPLAIQNPSIKTP